jgi:single-strand DNA-binding protein
MQSFSNVTLGGNLGDDPIVRGEKEKLFASMQLAINRKWKKDDGIHEATDWIRVSVPSSLVNVVQNYVHKGDPVIVQGELRTRQWKKGEEKHTETYVMAKRIMLVKSRADKEACSSKPMEEPSLAETAKEAEGEIDADFLPFSEEVT